MRKGFVPGGSRQRHYVTALLVWMVGCAAANRQPVSAAPKEERRAGAHEAQVSLDGNVVVVQLSQLIGCRQRDSQQWNRCGAESRSGVDVVVSAGGTKGTAKTDAAGGARIDLSIITQAKGAVQERAYIYVDLPEFKDTAGLSKDAASIDISATPAYAAWKDEAKRASEREARDEKVSRAIAAVEKLERNMQEADDIISNLERTKDPWGEREIAMAQKALTFIKDADVQTAAFKRQPDESPDERIVARLQKAMPLLERMSRPEYEARMRRIALRLEKVRAKEEQQRKSQTATKDQDLFRLGRKAALTALVSPSTAHFVADKVLVRCPNATKFATEHEVDSQNRLGAMVRGKVCAEIDTATGKAFGVTCGDVLYLANVDGNYMKMFCDVGLVSSH